MKIIQKNHFSRTSTLFECLCQNEQNYSFEKKIIYTIRCKHIFACGNLICLTKQAHKTRESNEPTSQSLLTLGTRNIWRLSFMNSVSLFTLVAFNKYNYRKLFFYNFQMTNLFSTTHNIHVTVSDIQFRSFKTFSIAPHPTRVTVSDYAIISLGVVRHSIFMF